MKSLSTGLPDGSRPAPCISVGRRQQAGFTLVEVLTALAVLAVVLTGLFQALATGMRSVASASQHTRALIVARSTLDAAMADGGRVGVEMQGTDGEFTWAVSQTALYDVPPATKESKGARLYGLVAIVSWPPGRRLELVSRRLAPLP